MSFFPFSFQVLTVYCCLLFSVNFFRLLGFLRRHLFTHHCYLSSSTFIFFSLVSDPRIPYFLPPSLLATAFYLCFQFSSSSTTAFSSLRPFSSASVFCGFHLPHTGGGKFPRQSSTPEDAFDLTKFLSKSSFATSIRDLAGRLVSRREDERYLPQESQTQAAAVESENKTAAFRCTQTDFYSPRHTMYCFQEYRTDV